MLRTRLTWTASGGPAVSTMCWMATEDGAGALAVRTALNTFWTAVKGEIGGGLVLSFDGDIDVVDPITGLQTSTLTVASFTVTGTGAGDVLPPNNQYLARWRTGQYENGHERRGRTFVPNPTETNNSGGAVLAATLTNLNTWAANLAADATAELGVYSPTYRSIRSVSSGTFWSKFAALRSRRD